MTAQESDILHYRNRKYYLFCEPLEDYWTEDNPKPDFEPPDTACWRGYVASWTIIDGKLYLVSIDTDNDNLKLDKIFYNNTGMVFADWFTGELRIPQGKMIEYVHMGYESVYERELSIIVERGNIVRERNLDN